MYNNYKRYKKYNSHKWYNNNTFSAWVSFLKPKFQKMSSIIWKRFLLITEIFLTTAPLAEYLWRKGRKSNNLPICKQTVTYKSILASSNSSKLFSHVGWNKDKSKAFARRGHIALSMTSKLKNLSPELSRLFWNKLYNNNNKYNAIN